MRTLAAVLLVSGVAIGYSNRECEIGPAASGDVSMRVLTSIRGGQCYVSGLPDGTCPAPIATVDDCIDKTCVLDPASGITVCPDGTKELVNHTDTYPTSCPSESTGAYLCMPAVLFCNVYTPCEGCVLANGSLKCDFVAQDEDADRKNDRMLPDGSGCGYALDDSARDDALVAMLKRNGAAFDPYIP